MLIQSSLLYPATVDVLAGPMTVTSMSSGVMWSGWFTSIEAIDPDSIGATPVDAETVVWVCPKDINLRIWSGHDSYRYRV